MGEFLNYFKKKKTLVNLLILGILILALPLGIELIREQQILKSGATQDPIVFTGDNVSTRNGKAIALRSQISLELTSPLGPPTSQPPIPNSTNFSIGFNVTGIIHYGYGDLLKYASSQDTDVTLKEISRMKGKIIRVFVANENISDNEAASRLDSFLTKAASSNISVIASLINFYGDNGFRPQGTQKYYTDQYNGISLLNHDFFASGYKQEYLSFLKTVVARNKGHTNIYAWEAGNELKDNNSPQTFINFMKDVTKTIKMTDPVHPVATGMMNAAHTALSPAELYTALPDVDIITIHNYNGGRSGLADVTWARSQGKTVILEEMGIAGSADRSSAMKQELDFWESQGVKAVLQWGFLAKGLIDNGNGDKTFGMDTIWHSDYDQLATLFTSYN